MTASGQQPEEEGAPVGPFELLAGLWRHLRPYRRKVWILVLLLLVDAGLTAGIPLVIKSLVDLAIVPRDAALLRVLLAVLAGATVIVFAVSVARDWFYARLGSAVVNDIRLAMFDQFQRLSASFHARAQAGDLMARFTTDLVAVEGTITTVLPWGTMAILTIVASLVVLFTLQWQLALLALLAVPLSLVGPRIIGPGAAAAGYKVRTHDGRIASAVQEALAGQTVVRAFNLEPRTRRAFIDRLAAQSVHSRRFQFFTGLVQRTPNLAVGLVHLVVLASAAILAFRGALTVGSLLSFDLVFLNFAGGVASLTEIAPSFLRASGGLARIQELLDEQPSVADPAEPKAMPRLSRAIEFRGVAFEHDGRPVLSDLSFEVERGARVAFVGRSGSGKSTVLNLVLRFHDPSAGAVLIDGVDLREARQADVRRQMAIVSQESFLFDGSIRDNLLAVRPLAAQDELVAAARAVEALGFIEALPSGFDTQVGERGGRLSGGQRQRLAIARALLADPEILLLDEATSALDAATEAAVDDALVTAMEGRTVLTVTHRLRSIAGANRIFVLDGGRMVEQGSHEELLRLGGTYAEIWNKQAGLDIGEDGTTASISPERLRLTPILGNLDAGLLEELALRFASEQVPGDRLVLQEGDPADRFYIVARGQVEVSKRDARGQTHSVGVLQTGDHFGEIALLDNVPRTATVRTLTPSLFLTLQRAHFLDLVERMPGLRARLETIAERRAKAELAGFTVG